MARAVTPVPARRLASPAPRAARTPSRSAATTRPDRGVDERPTPASSSSPSFIARRRAHPPPEAAPDASNASSDEATHRPGGSRGFFGSALAFAAAVATVAPVGPPCDYDPSSPLARLPGASSSSTAAYALGVPEAPAFVDPWKEGRARKAAERAAAKRAVDEAFAREAEQRAENERLSAAYYAKAAAQRRARVAAERDDPTLPAPELDRIAAEAGRRAFEDAVAAIDQEQVELRMYEERQERLRATAEARNAEALDAMERAEAEERARRAEAEAELSEAEGMKAECVGADSPLREPGSVQCT